LLGLFSVSGILFLFPPRSFATPHLIVIALDSFRAFIGFPCQGTSVLTPPGSPFFGLSSDRAASPQLSSLENAFPCDYYDAKRAHSRFL